MGLTGQEHGNWRDLLLEIGNDLFADSFEQRLKVSHFKRERQTCAVFDAVAQSNLDFVHRVMPHDWLELNPKIFRDLDLR